MSLDLNTLLKAKQEQKTGPRRVLDDLPFLFKDVCGLKLDGVPFKTGLNRKPKAWADLRPGSAWMLGWNFLRKPLPPGKYGRLLLEPRGCAKSVKVRTLSTGTIIVDRDTIIHYLSQSGAMASNRVTFVKNKLKANEGRFGEFETRDNWGTKSFTVARTGTSDEPTMEAGGPGKDMTGSHPDIFIFDDIVVKETNTPLMRAKILATFEDVLDQRAESSEIIVIGTRYDGHNLYEEILTYYRDVFEILIIGAWGPAYDGDGQIVWGSKNDDTLSYPWFTDEFLKSQRNTPSLARKFPGRYLNQKVTSLDASFEANFLIEGDPPMTKDGKLDPRLAVYMVADLAQTDKPTKKTSETALIVIAKDADHITYIIDINIGRWNPADRNDKFLEMYYRWMGQGLRYATLEATGPGLDGLHTIPQMARIRDKKEVPIIPIPRASTDIKEARIGSLYEPFRNHRIRFSSKLIHAAHGDGMAMFRVDSRGVPIGIASDRIINYDPNGETPNDFMDALADAYAVIKDAPMCPDPTPSKPPRQPMTDMDWSVARASGRIKGRYIRI